MERMLDAVTILRGIAALIIIGIHAPLPVSQINTPLGISIAAVGFVGIYAFFFISGFILGKRYLERKYCLTPRGILSFYFKRLGKIAPLYYLVLIYLFVVSGDTPGKIADFARLLVFAAPPKPAVSQTGYLWFISSIMQMYILAPLGFFLLDFVKKQKLSAGICLFLIILLAGSLLRAGFLSNSSYEFITESTLANLYIFALGMEFSLWFKNFSLPIALRITTLLFTLWLFYLGLTGALSAASLPARLFYQTIIVPAASFLFIAVVLSSAPAKMPAKTYFPFFPFQLVGIFSYEVYLLHQPVFNKLGFSCAENCTPFVFIANVAVVTVVSLVLAAGIRKISKIISGKG